MTTLASQAPLALPTRLRTGVFGLALTCTCIVVVPTSEVLAQVVEPVPTGETGTGTHPPGAPGWIEVRSSAPDTPQPAGGEQPVRAVTYGLRYSDLDRLKAEPSFTKAVPVRESPARISRLENAVQGRVVGTTHGYVEFNRLEIDRGRFLTDADEIRHHDHVVLGAEAARVLFPGEDPVGQRVEFENNSYVVIGVAKPRTPGRAESGDKDKDVFIPLNSSRARLPDLLVATRGAQVHASQLSRILVQGRDDVTLEETASRIRASLKPFHPRGGLEVEVVRPETAVPTP